MKSLRFLFAFAALLLVSCVAPIPVPTPAPVPTPSPDAPVLVSSDIFTGALVKCAQASAAPVDEVRTCLDAANTDACLVGLADPYGYKPVGAPIPAYGMPKVTDDAVIISITCTVRDLEMKIAPDIAKGTATEAQRLELEAASRWINGHGIGFYAE
jgi:hypothetical protein